MNRISVKGFLSRINYKPKFIGKDFDGCVFVQFRDYGNFSPSLEFGTILCGDETCGQDVYFEILDLRGYRFGQFIPINSDFRKCIIHGLMNRNNVNVFSTHINDSLHELYSGSLKLKFPHVNT